MINPTSLSQSSQADVYALYSASVSPPWWSLSFAATLWVLKQDAETAVDLGSGWSSYVLQSAYRNGGYMKVTSVDTDREWAKKTSEFLRLVGCPAPIYLWDDAKPAPHDLVIFDIGGGEREKKLDKAAEWLAPGGVMYVDDAHRDYYREAVAAWATQKGWRVDVLKAQTMDPYGRYGMAIHRGES